jgi:hypothetical protein
MTDGMIGNSHVTIPDLLEPVVGFRTFKAVFQEARPAWDEKVWTGANPKDNPFIEPREYVTDPYTGKLVKNYTAIADAFQKWQASLGTFREVHHPAIEKSSIGIISPNQFGHVWDPGKVTARCSRSLRGDLMHNAPDPDCGCGLYSYYKPDGCVCGGDILLGIVTQWGKIEAHSTGMRSEFMEIGALLGAGRVMKILAEDEKWKDVIQFSLDDVSRVEFTELASEFGSPLPEGMRPKVSLEEEIDLALKLGFSTSNVNGVLQQVWGNQPVPAQYVQPTYTWTPPLVRSKKATPRQWFAVLGVIWMINVVNLIFHFV